MNKEKRLNTLLWLLLVAIGAGLGLWLAQLTLPVVEKLWPDFVRPVYMPYAYLAALSLLGAAVLALLAGRIRGQLLRGVAFFEHRWDKMEERQIFYRVLGLIAGLVLAFLCARLLLGTGSSVLTFSMSLLMYVLFGYTGLRLGDRRWRRWKAHGEKPQEGFRHRRHLSDVLPLSETPDDAPAPAAESTEPRACPKVLDSSVIIDGRLLPLYRCGLLEGRLIVPDFVLNELQQLSDSADPTRRLRGRRGLELLGQLKELGAPVVLPKEELLDGETVDTGLLRYAGQIGGLCLTNDTNLCKVAAVAGVRTLSLFELFSALRLTLAAGDVIQADITREGKEAGQGVAYLDDGTMLVVEDGRGAIGQTVSVIVTSVLQTSAGRMVFARMEAQA